MYICTHIHISLFLWKIIFEIFELPRLHFKWKILNGLSLSEEYDFCEELFHPKGKKMWKIVSLKVVNS